MSKKISLGVAATIAIIAMAVTFSLTMVVSMKMFNTTVSSVKNKERQYNKLSEIDRFVRAGEFFTIDEDTLNDKLAAGYMSGINDRYAVYYTAKEYSEKQAIEKGTLTGIGVAVVNDASSGYARIIRVYNNSPASEAGLQVGGFITAIGEESTKNIGSTARLTSRLLGEEGTTTVITYLTPDRQEQQLSLVHSNYKTPTISTSQLTAGTCGYLRIDAFTTGTASEFKTAVDNLLQQACPMRTRSMFRWSASSMELPPAVPSCLPMPCARWAVPRSSAPKRPVWALYSAMCRVSRTALPPILPPACCSTTRIRAGTTRV